MFSFEEKIKMQYGKNVTPRGLSKQKKILEEKKKVMLDCEDAIKRNKAMYEANPSNSEYKESLENALNRFDKARADYESFKDALFRGDVFDNNTPDKNLGVIKTEGALSLADLYGIRVEIDAEKTPRFVVENYNDTSAHEIVAEGDLFPTEDLKSFISVIKSDSDSIEKIGGIVEFPEAWVEDDENIYEAVDSVQAKHSKNAETMLLCSRILESKAPVSITAETLKTVSNTSLSPRAKINAEIIVNESGFSKLDVTDVNGNLFVKKNFEIGEFVFADRYIIRIISDDILKNFEDGTSPCMIGDFKNVLRLVVVKKYPHLEKLDLDNCRLQDRSFKKIIPLLTTSEDSAFFVGAI